MLAKYNKYLVWIYSRIKAPRFVKFGHRVGIDPSVKFMRHKGTIDLGDRVRILRDGELLAPIRIGSGCFINKSVYMRPDTSLGRNVNVGPYVKFVTDSHEIASSERRAGTPLFKPITVGDGAWIGAGALILGGVSIGSGSIVGAGSVVVKDVPPNCVYAGNPAKFIRELT